VHTASQPGLEISAEFFFSEFMRDSSFDWLTWNAASQSELDALDTSFHKGKSTVAPWHSLKLGFSGLASS
jgi:hypothetical protein